MKKKIAAALAATFALGVTSAFAANPFSDVPAKHWAYESVSKLQKAGIVEGYSNGQFGGDKNMTRYEMAIVVAKAMTKMEKADAEQKASINKLAAEFGSELKNLGVRVEALEKNASSIKFSGETRLRYKANENANAAGDGSAAGYVGNKFAHRWRLYATGNVNEDISFAGRMVAEPNFRNNADAAGTDTAFTIDYANFTYKKAFGSVDISAGRYDMVLGYGQLAGTVGAFDAFKVAMGGDQVKAWFAIGDNTVKANTMSGGTATANKNANVTIGQVTYTPNTDLEMKLSGYFSNDSAYAYKVWALGAKYKVSPVFTVIGEYAKNQDATTDQDKSYYGQVIYKGADKAVPGSFGLFVQYWKAGAQSVDHSLSSLNFFEALTGDQFIRTNGIKAWGYGFNYTYAKNAVFAVSYQDPKSYDGSIKRDKYLYVQTNLYF